MKLPEGEYIATLTHHPNQRPNEFVANIVEGEHRGKGMRMVVGNIRCVNLKSESEEVENEN